MTRKNSPIRNNSSFRIRPLCGALVIALAEKVKVRVAEHDDADDAPTEGGVA